MNAVTSMAENVRKFLEFHAFYPKQVIGFFFRMTKCESLKDSIILIKYVINYLLNYQSIKYQMIKVIFPTKKKKKRMEKFLSFQILFLRTDPLW